MYVCMYVSKVKRKVILLGFNNILYAFGFMNKIDIIYVFVTCKNYTYIVGNN